MLATALRSLILVECEGSDGSAGHDASPAIVAEFPLEGLATSLGWDVLSQRIVVAVSGAASDRLCFCDAGEESVEEVPLPAGAQAMALSFFADPERRKSWAAVACSDGALRLVDASPMRTASVVRSCYSHGVAATAVAISRDGKSLASGSSSGHVVLQPFHGGGPTPLPGLLEADEAGIEALCYSSLRQEILASSDQLGNLQVWDAQALRHSCRFLGAHRGSVRGLSFSTQNSDLLISGGDDAELIFWDVKNSKQIQQVSVESGITSLSYHSGGYLLASGMEDGAVLIFDLRMLVSKKQPAEPLQRFTAHEGGNLVALAFAPDDAKLPKQAVSPRAAAAGASVPTWPTVRGSGSTSVKAESLEEVPSYATLESIMDRLSKRAVPDDAASTHSADGRTPLSPWPGSSQAKVPPLPGPARELPDTPQDSRKSQVPRYSIGSPLDTAKPEAASPWWKQVAEMEPKAAEREDESPVAADPPEVLQPLLAALREDFKRELQEAQLAMMEQNFRLHAELRKDVDALRREVQQLRGELRVL